MKFYIRIKIDMGSLWAFVLEKNNKNMHSQIRVSGNLSNSTSLSVGY